MLNLISFALIGIDISPESVLLIAACSWGWPNGSDMWLLFGVYMLNG